MQLEEITTQQITALLKVDTERPTPSLVEEEAPFQSTQKVLEGRKV
jgi:hypothetical protein